MESASMSLFSLSVQGILNNEKAVKKGNFTEHPFALSYYEGEYSQFSLTFSNFEHLHQVPCVFFHSQSSKLDSLSCQMLTLSIY